MFDLLKLAVLYRCVVDVIDAVVMRKDNGFAAKVSCSGRHVNTSNRPAGRLVIKNSFDFRVMVKCHSMIIPRKRYDARLLVSGAFGCYHRDMITCDVTLVDIHERTLLVLPMQASAELPSRGLVMVKGSINGKAFSTALEPDGRGSHWFDIADVTPATTDLKAGDAVAIEMESTKNWPEPAIPDDLQAALDADSEAYELWRTVTPMARWDWIRWIRSTNNPETRAKHIVVAFSKLKNGTRRPCCFNRSMCTDMTVSKSGVLATN